jgi:hypothetical protein
MCNVAVALHVHMRTQPVVHTDVRTLRCHAVLL